MSTQLLLRHIRKYLWACFSFAFLIMLLVPSAFAAAPNIAGVTAPTGNINIDPSITFTVEDTGTGIDAATVIVSFTGATTISYATTDTELSCAGTPDLSCTFTTSGLTDGTNNYQIDASDSGATAATSVTGSFVLDTVAPVLPMLNNVTNQEATSAGGAVVNYAVAAATDAIDGAIALDCLPVSGTTFAIGTTTVTCDATDSAGNTAIADTFTVEVVDTTGPVMPVLNNVTAEEATSSAGATVNYTVADAADAVDGAVTLACTPASGTVFALGTTTVNCTATDAATNQSTGSFTVEVVDTTDPVLPVLNNVTGVEATSSSGAAVTYTVADATDIVDAAIALDCLPVSGATFSVGTTTVTCDATDSAGNTAIADTFTVEVVDTTAPVMPVLNNVTGQEATSAAGVAVVYTVADAVDVVDGNVTLACIPASGTVFPIGTTTVSCSATDAATNQSTGSFTVEVVDTTNPTVTITTSPSTPTNASVLNFAFELDDSGIGVDLTTLEIDFNDGTTTVSFDENDATCVGDGSGGFDCAMVLNAPADISDAVDWDFDITVDDLAGNTGTTDGTNFTLDQGGPSIGIITEPVAQTNATTIIVEATITDLVSGVDASTYEIEFTGATTGVTSYTFADAEVVCNGTATIQTCTFTEASADLGDDNYTYEVRVNDSATNSSTQAGTAFLLDITDPVISAVVSPADPTGTVSFTFDVTDNLSGVDLTTLQIAFVGDTIGADGVFTTSTADAIACTANTAPTDYSCTFTTTALTDDRQNFTISVDDVVTNSATDATGDFLLDTTRPTISNWQFEMSRLDDTSDETIEDWTYIRETAAASNLSDTANSTYYLNGRATGGRTAGADTTYDFQVDVHDENGNATEVSGVQSVEMCYRARGTDAYTCGVVTLALSAGTTYTGVIDISGLDASDDYDFRIQAIDVVGNQRNQQQRNIIIDNVIPDPSGALPTTTTTPAYAENTASRGGQNGILLGMSAAEDDLFDGSPLTAVANRVSNIKAYRVEYYISGPAIYVDNTINSITVPGTSQAFLVQEYNSIPLLEGREYTFRFYSIDWGDRISEVIGGVPTIYTDPLDNTISGNQGSDNETHYLNQTMELDENGPYFEYPEKPLQFEVEFYESYMNYEWQRTAGIYNADYSFYNVYAQENAGAFTIEATPEVNTAERRYFTEDINANSGQDYCAQVEGVNRYYLIANVVPGDLPIDLGGQFSDTVCGVASGQPENGREISGGGNYRDTKNYREVKQILDNYDLTASEEVDVRIGNVVFVDVLEQGLGGRVEADRGGRVFGTSDVSIEDIDPESWAKPVVVSLMNDGVVKKSAQFRPNDKISRSEVAVMSLRAFGFDTDGEAQTTFADVPSDHWSARVMDVAKQEGIIGGYEDGSMHPFEHMTREQVLKVVLGAAKIDVINTDTTIFDDVPHDHWSTPYIQSGRALGVVSGYGDGTFGFEQPITRAEFAKWLYEIRNIVQPTPLAAQDVSVASAEPNPFQSYILDQINTERIEAGKSIYRYDADLAAVADGHVQDVATTIGQITSMGSDDRTPAERLKAAKIGYGALSENVAAASFAEQTVYEALDEIHLSIMNQPIESGVHNQKANVLGSHVKFDIAAPAVYIDMESEIVYVVVDFVG